MTSGPDQISLHLLGDYQIKKNANAALRNIYIDLVLWDALNPSNE